MMNRNKIYDNILKDYYGSLLTARQNEILDLYLTYDLSMSEIAERLNISKTAVADILNRSYKQLDEYENKLKLIELAAKREALYSNILKEFDDKRLIQMIESLRNIN